METMYYPGDAIQLEGPETVVIRLKERDFSILASDLYLYPDAEVVTDEYQGKIAPCMERRRKSGFLVRG